MHSSDGVVVITSASHAEGCEFDPRSKYFLIPSANRVFTLYFHESKKINGKNKNFLNKSNLTNFSTFLDT